MPEAQAREAVAAGRVKLDNSVVRSPFSPVPAGAKVSVDGVVVDVRPLTRVLVFHKPAGLVVSGRDPHGGARDDRGGTVFDALSTLLPEALRGFGWLAVGRLDRDTTGVLLFTNDERFVGHATHPSTHLPKRYVVRVGGELTAARLETLRRGVTWEGITSRPAKAHARAGDVLELTLTEGKYHQVKRMLNEVGLATLQLHREAVGDYVLDVPLGELRELSAEEIRRCLSYEPRG